jgi:hypothetical protein
MLLLTQPIHYHILTTHQIIRRDYYNLKYIVYKSKYLFPVPPRLPFCSPYSYWANTTRKSILEIQRKVPEPTLHKTLSQYYLENKQTDPKILGAKEEWLQLRVQYYQQRAFYN